MYSAGDPTARVPMTLTDGSVGGLGRAGQDPVDRDRDDPHIVAMQNAKKERKPEDPRPPSCLTCVHWWPRSEGGGTCGKVIGTQNVTAPDDWCREHQPRGLRGVPIREQSW